MRGLFSLLGLLVTLALVGMLVRKQMTAMQAPLLLPQVPASAPGVDTQPTGNVAQQSQQIQQQYKQAIEGAMQQARPMPDDDK
jgi:hypothetical protein